MPSFVTGEITRPGKSKLREHKDFIAQHRPDYSWQEIADLLREKTNGEIDVVKSTVFKFAKVRGITEGYPQYSHTRRVTKPTEDYSSNMSAIEKAKAQISENKSETTKQTDGELQILTEEEARRLLNNQSNVN